MDSWCCSLLEEKKAEMRLSIEQGHFFGPHPLWRFFFAISQCLPQIPFSLYRDRGSEDEVSKSVRTKSLKNPKQTVQVWPFL